MEKGDSHKEHSTEKPCRDIPEGPADIVRNNAGQGEKQRGKNLYIDPRFSEELKDEPIEKRYERQVGPGMDIPAPFFHEIANSVYLEMLCLCEIPGSINNNLWFTPENHTHSK
jgi:hypothetical protein